MDGHVKQLIGATLILNVGQTGWRLWILITRKVQLSVYFFVYCFYNNFRIKHIWKRYAKLLKSITQISSNCVFTITYWTHNKNVCERFKRCSTYLGTPRYTTQISQVLSGPSPRTSILMWDLLILPLKLGWDFRLPFENLNILGMRYFTGDSAYFVYSIFTYFSKCNPAQLTKQISKPVRI